MKYIKTGLIFVVMMATIGTASAQREFDEIYKECGLGAMLFPDDPIIAVITNVTWDLGTTAVISELSSPETCKGNASSMAAFILDTHPQLEQDLTVGEGTHLSSVMTLMGCEGNADASHAFRASFAEAVAQDGYFDGSDFDKSETLYNAATQISEQYCTI
ncbi:DUF3015 family protein [Saccharospirillum salsuginis]|uniref:DUF3015 domain-containing protein n=1 Tax=Saccharospirillum salsuginis TaxID=418750 RepID=A0A918K8T5_9GAMM|nr:DUF3015 family protein [Saccharospirillum salsuginis]GGX52776.1 hypothetical protein GCM10007392_20240 [Saccharospirillum salsuginis]